MAKVKADENYLNATLLEVLRLFPPIIGCCREASVATSLNSRNDSKRQQVMIDKGSIIWCSFISSHRDAEKFDKAEEFIPDRWLGKEKNSDLFAFGLGERTCLGRPFVMASLRIILSKLLASLIVKPESDQDLTYRWLPVARPSSGFIASVTTTKN